MALRFAPVRGVVSSRTLEDSCRISTHDQGDTHPNNKSLFSHEPPFSPRHRPSMEEWRGGRSMGSRPVLGSKASHPPGALLSAIVG